MAAIKLYYNKTTYQLIGIDDGGISIVVGDTGTKEFWFYFGTGATVALFVNDATIPVNYLGRVVIERPDATVSGELYLTPMNGTGEGYYKLIVNEWLSAVEGNCEFTARLKVSDGNGGYNTTPFTEALIPVEAGALPGDDTISLVQYNAVMDAVDDVIAGTTPIAYDNTTSELVAVTVDEAIDEIDTDLDLVEARVTVSEDAITALDSEKEDVANKVLNFDTADDTQYPSALTVKTALDLKEALANKAVDFGIKNNTLYPTTKAVDDTYVADTDNPVVSVTMDADFILTVTYLSGAVTTHDIPAEMAFVDVSYDNTTKDLTFELQNGTTIDVPLDDILTGLATEIWVEANYYTGNQSDLKYEILANKVTMFNPIPTDTEYPSAKLVKDELDRVEDLIVAGDTNAEVIVARGTYDSLGDRLDAINDVAVVDVDYTEKLSSTYGVFNPEDNGIPMVKEISGRTIPALANLLTAGGDFASGWTITDATGTVAGGVYPFTASAQNGGISQAFTQVSGNIYYIVARVKASSVNVKMQVNGEATSIVAHGGTSAYQLLIARYTASSSGSVTFEVIDTNTSGWAQVDVDYAMVHNLTAKFGSSLEPTTAVMNAIVEALGTSGYISTTSTTHLLNSQFKTTGKNLFDKSTIVAGSFYSITGTLSTDATSEYSTQFISVKPSTAYYASKQLFMIEYDVNKVFIKRTIPAGATTFTTQSNTYYIKVSQYQLGLGQLALVQLEQGSTATTYAPYNSETQLFNHSRLSKLPNLVADKIRYDNGAYVLDRYVQEYTLLSTDITAMVVTNTNLDYAATINPTGAYVSASSFGVQNQAVINGYIGVGFVDSTANIGTWYKSSSSQLFLFGFAKGTTLAQAQTALTGKTIFYQLATPVLATSTIDVDGTLIQETVTTLEQLQTLPTTLNIEYSMNVEQTAKTLVQRDMIQQEEIDALETLTATKMTLLGGTTANRTASPTLYQMYFDTTLNVPIWWNGTNWVNHAGTTV